MLGSALGAALGSGDDLANDMGYGFGRLVIPALLVGGLWPFVARRTSRWFIPLVVLGIGALITVLVNAGQAAP